MLLLHGITASRRYWTPRIRDLSTRFRLLIPDLPGFGRSPKPFVDYTMDFFVETLDGFLDQAVGKDTPVRLLAHSLGALIGLELAARRPARLQRLALLNVPRFKDAASAHRIMFENSSSYRKLLTVDSLTANLAQVRRAGLRLSARYLRRLPWTVLADTRQVTFRSLSSTVEHVLLHYRVDSALGRLPANTRMLLIHGDRDQVAPLETVRELPARHPHPRLEVIRGASHNLFHTHHNECLPLLIDFLD